ncbi:hypothetical protein G7Y89_g14522 [Cudoniella acicularis]|uniref:Uncharacterized protein n=1 Tax=Cudoniella acicularis TaxID=354080 RepID=A0A8H4VSV9_9HELO|nr:hypothetical protein G7Y89_g14522 [Cudoniella acicularis]
MSDSGRKEILEIAVVPVIGYSVSIAIAILAIIPNIYIIVAETSCTATYNYYAVVILEVIVWLFSKGGAAAAGFATRAGGDLGMPGTISAVCFAIIWLISLIYWIWMAVAISNHRKSGGQSRYHHKAGKGAQAIYGQSQTAKQRNTQSGEMSQTAQRGSVHYAHCDPYHPLRMHPTDSAPRVTIHEVSSQEHLRGQTSGTPACNHCQGARDGDEESGCGECHRCEEGSRQHDILETHHLAHLPTTQVVCLPEQTQGHNLNQDPTVQTSTTREEPQDQNHEECPTIRISPPEKIRSHGLDQCFTAHSP